eukprot:GDKJ01018383.1.p4 GENE.GDKJ01018383.1~~GDKJ01018383.1.p4  ORF type:complete len:111 (-),score=6.00 GDKJ01018383.1:1444-1776(-)
MKRSSAAGSIPNMRHPCLNTDISNVRDPQPMLINHFLPTPAVTCLMILLLRDLDVVLRINEHWGSWDFLLVKNSIVLSTTWVGLHLILSGLLLVIVNLMPDDSPLSIRNS